MRQTLTNLALCLLTLSGFVLAALAHAPRAHAVPPLSAAHAQFDDDDGCPKCHDSDDSVPTSKCLRCHQEIGVRINQGKGFHARVAGKKCQSCHGEHRGRGVNIIPLDAEKFDHNQAGWPLQGNHAKVRCTKCHTGTRRGGKTRTYLGVDASCGNCHKNVHGFRRASLKRCERCHNVFGWKSLNANNDFNHNSETSYALDGGHASVNCNKCHTSRVKFAPVAHDDCKECHDDEHRGLFGARPCDGCHVTKDFKTVQFAHNVQRFRLAGAHRKVACTKCHRNTNWQPPWKPPSTACNSCHKDDDPHRGQFGRQNCADCHSPISWNKVNFNHNSQSRFRLVGRHGRVACNRCHQSGVYKPIDTACVNCHKGDDPHQGKFKDKPCDDCHSPKDWKKVKFDHSVTRFGLTGAHSDVDCEKCHPGGDTERKIPSNCDGCHIDLHDAQFKDKLCGNCHSFEQWPIDNFAHNDIARFKLVGRHQEVPCDNCHIQGHFKPIQANCSTCHKDFHRGQMKDKVCEQCHSPLGWPEVEFVHNRDADYKLLGEHVTLDCRKCHYDNNYRGLPKNCETCHVDVHKGSKGVNCANCHTETSWQTNTAQVHFFGAYKLAGEHDRLPCDTCHTNGRSLGSLGHECVGCHRDPHFASFGPFCIDCHSQEAWLPSQFRHWQTGFRLTGQHRFVRCTDCHRSRVFGGLPTDCEFCHLDTVQRYVASPTGQWHVGMQSFCANCHTTLSWLQVRPGAISEATGGPP